MPHAVAVPLVWIALAWFAIGLALAVPFSLRRAARLDPDARHASWGFRLAILPAAALLWPYVWALRAGGDDPHPRERTAHRRASGEVRP